MLTSMWHVSNAEVRELDAVGSIHHKNTFSDRSVIVEVFLMEVYSNALNSPCAGMCMYMYTHVLFVLCIRHLTANQSFTFTLQLLVPFFCVLRVHFLHIWHALCKSNCTICDPIFKLSVISHFAGLYTCIYTCVCRMYTSHRSIATHDIVKSLKPWFLYE